MPFVQEKQKRIADTKGKKAKTPAGLLARLYPFMLSSKYSSASDLYLIGGCTEKEVDQMVQ
jgi:hypothetical protein